MYDTYTSQIINLLYDDNDSTENKEYNQKLYNLLKLGNEIYKLNGNKGLHIVLDILFQKNEEYSSRDYVSFISNLEKLWNDEFHIYQE